MDIPKRPATDATTTNPILVILIAFAKSLFGITKPHIAVIATITTTIGETNLAFTAASPTISAPIIDTVCPAVFGILTPASNNTSNAISIIIISRKAGRGTSCLLCIILSARVVGNIS